MLDNSILSLLIFLPVLFALIILSGKLNDISSFFTGLFSSAISVLLSFYIVAQISGTEGYSFSVATSWWLDGIDYRLAVDGLSSALIALTAIIFPLCILSVKSSKNAASCCFTSTIANNNFWCFWHKILFYSISSSKHHLFNVFDYWSMGWGNRIATGLNSSSILWLDHY